MKFLTYKTGKEEIELIPLSDLHLGSPESNLREIERVVRYIREKENARTILLGDLFETAIIGSKGDPYTADPIETEFRIAKELLKPIKDKILAVISGNHERRISKTVGLDIMRMFCAKLGIEDRYSPNFVVVKLRLKNLSYFIGAHHGVGGGRLKGGKINNLHRMGGILPNADIILMGHTHDFIMTTDVKYIIDKKHDRIKEHKTYYINVPAFLSYGGYGASYAYQPTISGAIKITLKDGSQSSKKNRIEISQF
ncbi:Calcineurin-like phosphoesterase superfamily domain-containing protein [Balnearium lithotrophicum]|uniref:Calcineurin-like phosphoesterase superfamily domain-containing protein n=1 Tax=Balnearium lithotrophicum TaxID=223788 RepID=A0A521DUK9_9BACT|nr:metallophosphoesterase [Balnearium lithotrophicum]SMO75423.1 Calcineurin-like phosphoesterase superfamily domain-containing protein [Balnearium lithotrophicum]